MPDPERPDPVARLRRWAERSPEEPALFFRGERGHFRWWSWGQLGSEIDGIARSARSSTDGGVAGAPHDLLGILVAPALTELVPLAVELERRLGPGPERDIWISWRPLEVVAERVPLATALLGGWAIVREPVSPLPAETFAWARPTILSGAVDELVELLDGFARLAPRWGAARWRRRRLARLRAVVVDAPVGTEQLASRLGELGASARIVPLPSPSMEKSLVVEREAEGEPR